MTFLFIYGGLITLYKEKETSLIVLRFKSWKDKNCPIINWK
jgi:hypothetical protein